MSFFRRDPLTMRPQVQTQTPPDATRRIKDQMKHGLQAIFSGAGSNDLPPWAGIALPIVSGIIDRLTAEELHKLAGHLSPENIAALSGELQKFADYLNAELSAPAAQPS